MALARKPGPRGRVDERASRCRSSARFRTWRSSTGIPPCLYQLRLEDFGLVMQDVYDFFFDVNMHLLGKGIKRLDEQAIDAAGGLPSRGPGGRPWRGHRPWRDAAGRCRAR